VRIGKRAQPGPRAGGRRVVLASGAAALVLVGGAQAQTRAAAQPATASAADGIYAGVSAVNNSPGKTQPVGSGDQSPSTWSAVNPPALTRARIFSIGST
jgi:hypothetical protein